MEGQPEVYDHKFYKHCDESEAESVAWAFVNNQKFVKFPYKCYEVAPNEIRANILYTGLCLSDHMHGRGKWGPVPYPVAPGHEIIGEVSVLGSEVKGFNVGDKVAFGTLRNACDTCKYCTMGRESLCVGAEHRFTYNPYFGGYSTHIQQPANFFFKLPENFDLVRGAPLLCAGITVYSPIKKYLTPGANCAVIGIGGLGHLAVKFLSKMGHKVTAVTSSLDKKDFILSLGATDVICVNDTEQMKAHSLKYDFVICTVPGVNNFVAYFNLLAPAGTFVHVGCGEATECLPVSVVGLVMYERKIVGSLVGSREDINEMLKLCADKDIYPIVEEFKFEEFDKGFDRLENGKPIFRVVVNVQDWSKANNFFK
jgi:uncharacterized zinc-type alcohol dehydrogenase-like protein